MRKKIVSGIGAMVLVLAFSTSSFAGINQEFRGLEWGTSPTRDMVFSVIEDLELRVYTLDPFAGSSELMVFQRESLKDAYIRTYTKLNENLHMGEIPLSSVVYMFYDNRFMEVRLYFNGKENYETLIWLCREEFGTFVLHYFKPRWSLWETTVEIFYNKEESKGYMQIHETYTRDCWRRKITTERKELAKIAAKKTEGDW